jgi:FG-GAP repeat
VSRHGHAHAHGHAHHAHRHGHARRAKRAQAALLGAATVVLAAAAVAAAAVMSAGCNPGDFGDLADQTWVDSTDAPEDLNSDDYGAAVAYAGSGGSGAVIAVASRAPAGAVILTYDAGGGLESRFRILTNEVPGLLSLPERPAMAAEPDAFGEAGGNVAIAATSGDIPYAVLFTADSFEFPEAIAFGEAGGAPRALAFGRTDAGGDDADLVALLGDQLWLVEDYLLETRVSYSCEFSGGRNLIIADIGTAAGDESEIVIAGENGLTLVRGSDVVAGACPAGGEEIGEPDDTFGAAMAAGDFDGNGDTDLAIGTPGSNAVYVVPNGSLAEAITVGGPSGSVSFGEAVAAGDIDDDESDELVVGDGGFGGEVSRGGAVHIMAGTGDDFESLVTLFDADPEEGQRFGRSLAIARFGGNDDILVVGASEEVFTYFRHPIEGDQDVRR